MNLHLPGDRQEASNAAILKKSLKLERYSYTVAPDSTRMWHETLENEKSSWFRVM